MRRVVSVSRSGSRDHRPATVGGPVRVGMTGRPYRERWRTGPRAVEWVVRPAPSSVRSGPRVSLVRWPAQTRSQTTAASAVSSTTPSPAVPTRSESWRKNSAEPPSSASSTRVVQRASSDSSPTGASSRSAVSASCSDTQPSLPGSEPCPAQSTSPEAVSSSSSAGE